MNESREASVHALVGAYAIDALTDEERTDFEAHLAECGDCQQEVASLREVAAVLGGAETLQPPAALRDRVLAGIAVPEQGRTADTATDTPDTAGDRSQQHAAGTGDVVVLSRRRFRMAAAGIAAAVLAAVGGGAVIVQQLGDEPAQVQAQPTLAERVQAADDVEKVAVRLDGATATVFRSAAMRRAVVVTEDMPPPPEGKVYELWFDDQENGFTPAGLMSTTSDQTLVLQGDASRASRVGITVEPAQGSRVPTTDPIAVFAFDSEQA